MGTTGDRQRAASKPAKSRAADVYATPRTVTDLQECAFYHTMDIPGYGLVEGPWDLRDAPHDYVGRIKLDGKRVLEIGTASGFLCFFMESKGAEVVAYDLSEDDAWDIVPYARYDADALLARRKEVIRRLNNGYWLAHAAHGSSGKVVYGTVYEIPEAIGAVDVTTFGAVLRHLRDPFLALQRALALTRETVVVTANPSLRFSAPQMLFGRLKPAMAFLPEFTRCEPTESWWHLTPDTVQKFIGVLGFERSRVTYHVQRYNGRRRMMYTVVGHRTHGSAHA